MKVHHSGHHQTYTDKLNVALAELQTLAPALAALPIATLLQRLPEVPEKVRGPIRNNGGGFVNHEFFFNSMAPGQGGAPTGPLADAITATFGSFDAFKEAFTAAVSQRRRPHFRMSCSSSYFPNAGCRIFWLGLGVAYFRSRRWRQTQDRFFCQPGRCL